MATTKAAVDRRIARRTLIALAGGAIAGGGVVALGSGEAAGASVTMGTLDIAGAEHSEQDPSVVPVVSVSAEWAYANVDDAAKVITELRVSDGTTTGTIDLKSESVSAVDGSGSVNLSRATTFNGVYETADWQPPEDGSVSHDVTVIVWVAVEDSAGSIVADAQVSKTVTIAVNDEASPDVQVGASGTVSFTEV